VEILCVNDDGGADGLGEVGVGWMRFQTEESSLHVMLQRLATSFVSFRFVSFRFEAADCVCKSSYSNACEDFIVIFTDVSSFVCRSGVGACFGEFEILFGKSIILELQRQQLLIKVECKLRVQLIMFLEDDRR